MTDGAGDAGEIEIQVSRARCIGSKACINTAGGVFRLDDVQISTVYDPAGDPLETILEAAESCPTGAITVLRNGERLA